MTIKVEVYVVSHGLTNVAASVVQVLRKIYR